MFDIVIPVGPNDISVIHRQIEYTKKNIIDYRNIYIIFKDDSLEIDGCITISESIFPFSIDTVAKYHGQNNRNGWYLQQLLKLYAGLVIPDILDKYLVIDADTFFLKPTQFILDNRCLYNFDENQYHQPYFIHMQRLHKDLQKRSKTLSGICHHMIFETKYILELFDMVEKEHDDTFYNIFLNNVTEIYSSGASEYEIYFNFIIWKHSDQILIRKLNWANAYSMDFNPQYDYVSYHWHIR